MGETPENPNDESADIVKQRNRQLLDNILIKQSSIFHPQEFWQSLVSFSLFNYELIKSPLLLYQNVSPNQRADVNTELVGVATGMLAALIFYIAINLIHGLAHRILQMRFWIQTFRINRRTLAKTEIWFNLILHRLFLSAALWYCLPFKVFRSIYC